MIIGIFRFLKQLLKFFCVVLPLMISGWFVVAIALLFVSRNQFKLPAIFRWYDNADAYIGRDTSVYEVVCLQGYWARYCWLAWRNPINYFGYKYLGFQFLAHGDYTKYNPSEDDIGDNSRAGFRHIEYEQWCFPNHSCGKDKYYEYYLIHKWSANKCLRFRFGWKIVNNKNPIGSYCQWVLVFQPYKYYSGK